MEEINLTTGQKLTRHNVFTSSWDKFLGWAMEVEMGEDNVCNPTGCFVKKGERRGTQCFESTCKCCKGKFIGRIHKLAMHIAGEKFANEKEMNVQT